MKTAYIKNLYREIPRSPMRFVMILVLLSIGSGLFYGQQITEASMRHAIDEYYAQTNLFDVWLHVDGGGLTPDMAEGTRDVPLLRGAQLGKQADVMASWGDVLLPVRVISLPTGNMNTPVIVQGRMPQAENECLGDAHAMTESPLQIGDEVTFSPGVLRHETMKVVGLANLPQLIEYTRGNTQLGNGRISCFILVQDGALQNGTYTDLYFAVEGARGMSPGSADYDALVREAVAGLSQSFLSQDNPPLSRLLYQSSFTLGGRELLDGYRSYMDDIDNTRRTYGLIPLLVYAIALLVCATSIMRVVNDRTADTAVLYALGEYGGRLWLPMFSFALVSSLLGSALGIVWGRAVVPRLLQGALRAKFPSLAPLLPVDSAGKALAAILLSVGIALCATALALRHQHRQIDARTRGRLPAIWLEKHPPIWRRLSFAGQISLRNIFRYKWRSFISLFCAAACAFLLYAVSGASYTLEETVHVQYDELQHYDLSVSTGEAPPEEMDRSLQALGDMMRMMPHYQSATRAYQGIGIVSAGDEPPIFLEAVIPSSDAPLGEFFSLRDARTYRPLSPGDSFVILSENAAAQLGVIAGDSINVTLGKETLRLTITDVCESHLALQLYISPGAYMAQGGKVPYQTILVRMEGAAAKELDSLAHTVMAGGHAQAVRNVSALKDEYLQIRRPMQATMHALSLITLCFAALVIYNLQVWAKLERHRELDTLACIGYTPFQVEAYLFRETAMITAVGIALGFAIAFFTNDLIIASLDGEIINYVRRFYPQSFVFSGIATCLLMVCATWIGYALRVRQRKEEARPQVNG